MASYLGGQLGAAVGTFLLGPVGTVLGYVAGSAAGLYVDSKYLIPALTPEPKLKLPELSDIAPTSGDEGRPMAWLYGAEARVSGTLLWLGRVRQRGGGTNEGKGSTEVSTSNVRYFLDFAVGWGTTRGAGVEAIAEVRANGEPIAVKENDSDLTSTELSVAVYTTKRWDNPTDAEVVDRVYMILTATTAGPDLSDLSSGAEATISGASNGGNNGTFLVARADADSVTGETFLWLLNSNAVTESAGASIRVQQTLPDENLDYYDAVEHFLGTPSQDPSSLIEETEEAGNVPGFRGVVYSTFDFFKLNTWGLRLPLLTAAIDVETGLATSNALGDLLELTGVESDQYDVSDVSGTHRGVSPAGPISARDVVLPMMLAYNLVAYEAGGQIVFRDRTSITPLAISTLWFGARDGGQRDSAYPFTTKRVESAQLPTEVVITYREPAKNLEPGTQRAKYPNASKDVVFEYDFPIAMTAQQAIDIAHRILWTYRASKAVAYELTLPPSAIAIQSTDVLTFTFEGDGYRLFVTRVERGANGLIRVEALREVLTSISFSGQPAEPPPTLEREFYTPPHTRLELLDIAPLRDQDADRWVLYYSASLLDVDEQYDKTDLAQLHTGGSWARINTMRAESVVGDVVGTLPDSSGISADWWDLLTTFDVQMYRGHTLTSAATDQEVFEGVNWALVGWEVIGFRYATLLGDGVYRLSRLLRGRRATRDWMTRHAENERFVLLRRDDEDLVKHKALDNAYRDRPLQHWSAIPHGGQTGDFEYLTYTYEGNSRRPFPPYALRTIRTTSAGNYGLFWCPTTRWLDPILPGPVARSSGRFRIRFWSGNPLSGGAELYTWDRLDTPRQTQYGASIDAQVYSLMGLSQGDPHWVTVSEIDPPFGEGLRSEPLFVDY